MIDKRGDCGLSIVVCATEVIAALGAHQLAMVAGKTMAARWADLAMVIDRDGTIRRRPRTTLRDAWSRVSLKVSREVRVEGAGTLGQHG